MTINLCEIEKVLGKATPGPWVLSDVRRGFIYLPALGKDGGSIRMGYDGGIQCNTTHNAHLIAHAPEWLRLLVERVKKLERLHKAMKNCRYYGWDEADAKPINDALAELEEKESP